MTGQQPVLIVIDDEPNILDVVGRFAVRAGFEVVACAGGREGIAKVQSMHADLVMVDLRCPTSGDWKSCGRSAHPTRTARPC